VNSQIMFPLECGLNLIPPIVVTGANTNGTSITIIID
jgi:hypothetical protein